MHPSFTRPYAITMWDFSWIERRWPGAGYEDWDQALEELAERGYNAVRIDAFPHLVSADPQRDWEILPVWTQTSWGAQSIVRITLMPALLEFIRAAQRHGVSVALSSWYREDANNTRMAIRTPEDQARIWIDTLNHIAAAGLLDAIIYVDLCNEFPPGAPYLDTDELARAVSRAAPQNGNELRNSITAQPTRKSERVSRWMRESIEIVRGAHPGLDYTYSFCDELTTWAQQDVTALDVLEPHVWMATADGSDYNARVGYAFERFDPVGFDNIVRNGRRVYEADAERYDALLFATLDAVADWSRATGKGLYTTECWALVDYKDWPGLEWDWIKDLTAKGVRRAAATGRWVGIATSNFCGPQFQGMWRDVEWHRELTGLIRSAPIDADLRVGRAGSPAVASGRSPQQGSLGKPLAT